MIPVPYGQTFAVSPSFKYLTSCIEKIPLLSKTRKWIPQAKVAAWSFVKQTEYCRLAAMKQLQLFSFAVDKLTNDKMCCAISVEALGFAALRALSDISAILLSSPVKHENNFKELMN